MDDKNEIEQQKKGKDAVQWERDWGTEELQSITLEELPLAYYPPPLTSER